MANCPKCNEKLSPLYFIQVCPHCGANLMYYDFEKQLESDANSAQSEWNWVIEVLNGIKKSTIGSVITILRLISFLLPVLALLLPVYKPSSPDIYGERISLILLIKLFLDQNGVNTVFENTSVIIMIVAFVCVVLFALISAVFSLLSFTQNGFKRNIAISIIDIAVFVGLSAAIIISGGGILYSFYLVLVFMLITLALNVLANKKM